MRSLAYDAAGNLLSDSRIGLTQTYTYNHAGRMATTSLNGSLRGTYKYNARHQLIRRFVTNSGTGNDGATHYVHDLAGNIIAEIDDTGATVREYIWLPDAGYAGLHLPLAVISAAGTYYVHADHLSRPVRMTDAGKATVWSVTWDAWGNGIPTGPAALDARLPGQWFQIESGLHYNWHRQYDPSLGRYTQPDPLGFVDGPSVYGYGRGTPLEAVDPDGQSLWRAIPVVVHVCGLLIRRFWKDQRGGRPRRDIPRRTRHCNPLERAKCERQCGARGVESCKVSQMFVVTRTKKSILIAREWKDQSLSCSCNE